MDGTDDRENASTTTAPFGASSTPASSSPRLAVSGFDAGHVGVEAQVDALLPHLDGQGGAHVVVEPAQEQRAPVELHHLGAQPVKDAREFHGDVAAAHDQHAAGKGLQVEGLVRREHELGPGNVGQRRPAPGGHQHVLGGEAAAVHRDGVGVLENGVSLDALDPRVVQDPGVDAVQTRNLRVLVLDERLPAVALRAHRPAESAGVLEVVAVMGRVHQQLLRNAPHVDTGAAEIALLGHRNPGPVARGDTAGPNAARAGAEGEQVVVVARHRSLRASGHVASKRMGPVALYDDARAPFTLHPRIGAIAA
jgi:hypothetical protein